MDIKMIIETLSHDNALDLKELVLIMFGEEKLETVYQSIKDTAN